MLTSVAVASLSDQIAEVNREIAMRKRLYPSWVQRGKMSESDARFHLSNMQAVLQTLETVREMRLTISRPMP